MIPNPKEIRENKDPDICIYIRHIRIRTFPYPSDRFISTFHNGRQTIEDYTGKYAEEPKDGDICPKCGREIIVFDEKTYI